MLLTTQNKKIFSPSAKGGRKSGHYWVLWSGRLGGPDYWRVGTYLENCGWHVANDTRLYYDSDFVEIDERRIPLTANSRWWFGFWFVVVMTTINVVLAMLHFINR